MKGIRHPRWGFTLMEVVIATAATSVLLLGVGSALLLASRALPDAHSPTARSVAAAQALEPMVAELQYALAIHQRSEHLIEFTVADRTGDGTPEVIRYEWSGAADAPLTRQYNGAAAVAVLAQVREFTLSYDLHAISTEVPQGNESAETFLTGHDSLFYHHDYTIRATEWYSEYFRPALPADTLSWRVTRVRFSVRQAGVAGGGAHVQLQTSTVGGLPTGTVLEAKTIDEPLLPLLYFVQELTFTQVSNLSPQQGLCLVFRHLQGAEACALLGQDKDVAGPNLVWAKSTNGGASWTALAGQSLLFSVYGTVTTTGTPQIQNTYYLDAVGIRLRAGLDSQATVQTGVQVLNRPEVIQ
ncbi:MAG: hypothetical protein MUC88_10160 [Planctomycetes bacterium]|jgi:type II secretory pathway component PulJ|nr:hypothetical protein [Planctomycetota bacterium]